MFNLFPKKKSVDEIIEDANLTPPWSWTPTQTPSMLQAQSEMIDNLLKENCGLKKEIEELKKDWHQPELCSEKISELTKEVSNLKHLKQENADLIEMLAKYRDGYQGSCYACEPVGELNQKLQKEKSELLKLYNGLLTKGDEYLKAKLQIVENDYMKCARERDEYKHQLNATNKELEELKRKNNYPHHWGGYTDETPWETAAADLALRVVKLEKQVEQLKLINSQIHVNKKS